MKKIIIILLMGLSLNVAASVQSIGSYKELAGGGLELTTNQPSVENLSVRSFLDLSTLEGTEGSAFKGALNVTQGEIFSFDWAFSTAWQSDTKYDDFSFVSLNLAAINIFSVLAKASDTNKSGRFEWTATESGLLNFGVGIMDLGDKTEDSSIVVSNLNPVPLPAAVWLFLSGIIGVFGFKQRKSI